MSSVPEGLPCIRLFKYAAARRIECVYCNDLHVVISMIVHSVTRSILLESGQFLHSRHVLGNRYGVVPATCWAPRSFCFTHRHQFAASDDNASDCQPPDIGKSEQKADGQSDQADDQRASENSSPVSLKLRLCRRALKEVPARRTEHC